MNQRRQTKIARNRPKQSRSRATVNAILEATIRVLDREGYEAATTTRVAEVAGVSIGTLYQYFSNRDAILDALQDRELSRAWEFMESVLSEAHRYSERELARKVILGLLELYAAAPALHRVLVIEGLRVTPADRVHAFDVRMVSAIRSFLALGHLRVRRVNLDAASFVIFQSVRAVMMARLLEAPANLDDDTLVEELTDLLVRYLVDESERVSEHGREQTREAGREQGREQSREQGREQGREHTREQGREHGRDHGREHAREHGRKRASARERPMRSLSR